MPARKPVTEAEKRALAEALRHENGVLYWRGKRPRTRRERAGSTTRHGYVKVCVNGKDYPGHCVVWLLETGEWPEGLLDHADGNPGNNSPSNLRPASAQENVLNRKVRSDSASGFKGVRWRKDRNKWSVGFRVKGRWRCFGHYDSAEEAARAFDAIAPQMLGPFVRKNFP